MWVTEFDEMPRDWLFALDIVNEIWTPSAFSARAFQNYDIPVKIIPHAVKVNQNTAMPRARFNVTDDAFLGIAIMDLTTCPERKNPLAHIDAWQRAFEDDPSAQLIIKARFGHESALLREKMKRLMEATQNIQLVETEFSDLEMTAFQRMADVYLSLHRAEGFGLNIREMLELGIPTVATGWSGNMDYLNNYESAYPIPYKIIPCGDHAPQFVKAGVWAEADISAASAALSLIRVKTQSLTSPTRTDARSVA